MRLDISATTISALLHVQLTQWPVQMELAHAICPAQNVQTQQLSALHATIQRCSYPKDNVCRVAPRRPIFQDRLASPAALGAPIVRQVPVSSALPITISTTTFAILTAI